MSVEEHMKPQNLLKYAFMWNEVRLVIAALSLLIGGSPILTYYSIPIVSGLAGSFMIVAWIISGLAAGYLVYLWTNADKKLWGGHDRKDFAAFMIAVVSGVHLGLAGLTGANIGINVIGSVSYGLLNVIMLAAGILYLWSAFHLFNRYKANPHIFG